MDLGEAGIGEVRSALVRAPDGGGVAALGVGGKVEDVAVAARAQHYRVADVGFELAGDQIARDDAARFAIDHNQVEHLGARVHLHFAGADLPFQRLVSAEEQLLARLSAGVEGARDLRAAERSVIEIAGILAGERHALRDTLIDDIETEGGQAVDVGLARAEIAALHGVVEEAEDAIAIVVIILGGVDAALRGDGVGAAGRILEAEAFYVVAEFGERGRGGSACQAGTHHQNGVFALVGRIHQLEMEAMLFPSLLDRTCR